MKDYTDYFHWLEDGGWIRVSARAIIFNRVRDRILVEWDHHHGIEYMNFIGGGVEVGETLRQCLERELAEETDARINNISYLFILENFYLHNGETRHSLEHYFEIELEHEDIRPKYEQVEFSWVPISTLKEIDLRPVVVRDRIMDGTLKEFDHLVLHEEGDAHGS